MTHARLVSEALYPRAALEGAAKAFQGICEINVEDVPEGVRVTVVTPDGAGREVADEFFNLALVAAVEIHLDTTA